MARGAPLVLAVAVAVALAASSVACSGSDDANGSATDGGVDGGGDGGLDPLIAAVCARQVQDGCDDFVCRNIYPQRKAVAEAFGCSAESTAYFECLASHAWTCFVSDGGSSAGEPLECSAVRTALDACAPDCTPRIKGTECHLDCDIDGVQVSLDCPSPSGCICSGGPKSGTTTQISACELSQMAPAFEANCE